MHMKNYEVKLMGDFFFEMKLKGKQNRMRTRFVSMLEEHLINIEKEREILIRDFAEKDEQGEIVVNEDGSVKFKDEDALKKEISILLSEEYIVEEERNNQDMFEAIREILEQYGEETEMNGEDAMKYERLCEILDI